MSKSVAFRTLALLFVLAVAGMAWASHPAATPPTPDAAPEAAPEAVVPTEADLEAALEELFLDPEETGACCFAECWDAWEACVNACPSEPFEENQACRQACGQERQSCTSQC